MTAVNLATADLFHAEIARLHGVNDRLRAEIERLRARPCPYVTGNVTQHCTMTPLTLTDAEREAVEWFAEVPKPLARLTKNNRREQYIATLRGLLERLK